MYNKQHNINKAFEHENKLRKNIGKDKMQEKNQKKPL